MKNKAYLVFLLLIHVIVSGAFAEEFSAGDRAAVNVDVNGDGVGEILTVTSRDTDPEDPLEFFEMVAEITTPRGTILYHDTLYGELGWFTVDVQDFELEGSRKPRETALIVTGCSGTGFHSLAWFLFQPKGVDSVLTLGDGNEGLYDSDADGVADMLVSVCRMQNLGYIGASSPWLPTFTRPSASEGWQSEDLTFQVLGSDSSYLKEWIDGIDYAYSAIVEYDYVETTGEDHLKYLKMLREALERNDMEEARNIYYTAF
ncbi:hypothetical protein JXM67_06625 [candidate division WOR-3 bacterium]|nr:hypothetical protein [candidate division WOR-3 bacterium]